MGRAAPHSRGPVASRKRDNRDSAPVGAPPTPLRGGRERKDETRAQQRAAGTNNTALFDIVRRIHGATARKRANERCVRAPSLSCPGRASVRERRAGPRGYTANRAETSRSVPWVPALVPFELRLAALGRDTRAYSLAPERSMHLAKRTHVAKMQQCRAAREAECYFDAESVFSRARASCTVVMNCAGKMMVEFFSVEISAMVWSVRS